MDDATVRRRDVTASLKYVVRGEKATFYAGERERSYWPGEEHRVIIHDIRGERDLLSFDRNGFVIVEEPSPVSDVDDPEQLAAYCRYGEGIVQRLTGAAKVVSFGAILPHQCQRDTRAQSARQRRTCRLRGEDRGRLYAPAAACGRGRSAAGEAARADQSLATAGHWSKVRRSHFAMPARCGGRTCSTARSSADWAGSTSHSGASTFPIPRTIAGAGCRRCAPTRCSPSSCSTATRDAVQFTAHTAFEDETAPPDAAPRQSIELRTISYFD